MTHFKPLHTLSLNDLQQYSCWKHALIDNEEVITPEDKKEISETDPDNYIVRTQFTLKDNSILTGFCSPQDTSGLDYIQPTIVTLQGHLPFYFENNVDTLGLLNQLLGKDISQIFPAKYRTEIKCDGNFFEGEIDNFNYSF